MGLPYQWRILIFFQFLVCISLTTQSPNCTKTQVFIDTDVGSDFDDGTAIMFALKNQHFEVQFILTATGDVVTRAKVLAKLLTLSEDDYAPIGIGLRNTKSNPVYMSGWAKHYNLSDYKGRVFSNGIEEFAKSIISNPCKRIVLLELAPATNIPPLFSNYPDVKKKVTEVKAMAGSIYHGFLNSSGPISEYNVKTCPECMRQLFQSGLSVTITPVDTCGVFYLDTAHFQTFLASSKKVILSMTTSWAYWCTNISYYNCTPKNGSDIFCDSVATFLMMKESYHLLNYKVLYLRITSDGYTVIDNEEGTPINVALTWKRSSLKSMQDIYVSTVAGAEFG